MMIVILFLLTLHAVLDANYLINTAQKISTPLQEHCFKIFAGNHRGSEIRQALLCGKKITDPTTHNTLKSYGLLHLVVVSGAHLILLNQLLKRLALPFWARWTVNTLFVFCSGFDPPAVRSWMQLLLEHRRWKHTTLFSALFCLLFFPAWLQSLSLWLSAMASYILVLSSQKQFSESYWKNQLWIQFAFFISFVPLTLTIGGAHPFAIVANLLAASLFGALWIPLALLPQSAEVFLWILTAAENNPLQPLPQVLKIDPIYAVAPLTLALAIWTYRREVELKRCQIY